VASFIRGGKPEHINGTTAVATVQKWSVGGGETMDFTIHNLHASATLELFFTKDAADLGAGNGILLVAGMGMQFPIELRDFWTYSASAVPFRALAVCRP
jgi:hypothetical protein